MRLDVPQQDLVKSLGEKLKSEISIPSWAVFVKTGVYKERPPAQGDWWFLRAASVLRKIQLLGPIGTSKLRQKYGGKKNRGVKAERSYKGSGKVIRMILQQLEEAQLVKQGQKGVHKGRILTKKGLDYIEEAAKGMSK